MRSTVRPRRRSCSRVAVAAVACSKSLDMGGLETQLENQLNTQLKTTGITVDCPSDIKAEAGGQFDCTGDGAGSGTITVHVTQTDSDGNVTWEVSGATTGPTGLDVRAHGHDLGARVLLEKKRLLITGVLTPQSIAFSAAQACQEQGAEIVLTGFGRGMSLTEKCAKRLPRPPDVLEMDANDPEQIEAVRADLAERWGTLDGFLHAIAFAPQDALGGNFLQHPVGERGHGHADQRVLAEGDRGGAAAADGGPSGGAIVSRSTSTGAFAWPVYDWMGVAKAGLEAVTRYLARDLGPKRIRVNTVSAGPLKTMAGKGIPGFEQHHRCVGASARRSDGTRRIRRRWATPSRSCSRTCRPASAAR